MSSTLNFNVFTAPSKAMVGERVRPFGPPAAFDPITSTLIFGENDAVGVPWYHPAFDTIQETPYTFHTVQDFNCKPNRGGTTAPLFQLNHWIETTPTPKPSNAAIVNTHDFLLTRARQCQKERGRLPNILAVDFAMTGDVVAVAAEMNGVAPAPAATVAALQERP